MLPLNKCTGIAIETSGQGWNFCNFKTKKPFFRGGREGGKHFLKGLNATLVNSKK